MSGQVRFMRLVLFFDLPSTTRQERKNYRLFIKFIKESGFISLQESVYAKVVVSERIAKSTLTALEAHKPPAGLVQVLTVTEKQFASMKWIAGTQSNDGVIDDLEDLVVI